eukprot:10088321-Heterocapsa_arctica.AAC.1
MAAIRHWRKPGLESRPTSLPGTPREWHGQSTRRTTSCCCRKPDFRGNKSGELKVLRTSKALAWFSRRQSARS